MICADDLENPKNGRIDYRPSRCCTDVTAKMEGPPPNSKTFLPRYLRTRYSVDSYVGVRELLDSDDWNYATEHIRRLRNMYHFIEPGLLLCTSADGRIKAKHLLDEADSTRVQMPYGLSGKIVATDKDRENRIAMSLRAIYKLVGRPSRAYDRTLHKNEAYR